MTDQKNDFINLMKSHETVLVTGPTGCGKSTKIPSWLCQEFAESKTLLIQPRRLPTTNIAQRICQINNFQMTREVGFVMGRRYYESPTNRLIVATSGSAVNLLLAKPDYYDFIIVDEIHEATEQIEQLLALTNQLQQTYKFKIILMSATVDATSILQKFQNSCHFEMDAQPNPDAIKVTDMEMQDFKNNKVISLPQQLFKEMIKNPGSVAQQNEFKNMVMDILENMSIQVAKIIANDITPNYDGDILCFVPGMKHIQELSKMIKRCCEKEKLTNYQIRFLHSRFSEEYKTNTIQSQQQIRTVIISTNICETSITIPTLSYVVDSCLGNHLLDDKLTTCVCSYEAIVQRLGRVGRCKQGVYIPCVQKELLEFVDASYMKDDIANSMDSFILQYHAQNKTNQILSIQNLLMQTSQNITVVQINNVLQTLTQNQYLSKTEDNYQLTPKGYISAVNKSDIEYGSFMYFLSFLQMPAVSVLINSIDKQSDLQIFVHELELIQNSQIYFDVKAIPYYFMIQYIAFVHNGSTVNFQCFNKNIIDMLSSKEAMMPILQAIANNSQVVLIDSYNDQYATAKIVALWREYFPLPTEKPTSEELKWCQQRLLSPQALREVELETISSLSKLKEANICEQLCYVDKNLLQMIYPATAEQIERFMVESNYNYDEIQENQKFQKHKEFWQKVVDKYATGYNPLIIQLLELEKRISKQTICQLLTMACVANNKFSTFIYKVEDSTYRQQQNNKKNNTWKTVKEPYNELSKILNLYLKQEPKIPGQTFETQLQQEMKKFCELNKTVNFKTRAIIKNNRLEQIILKPEIQNAAYCVQLAAAMLCSSEKLVVNSIQISNFNQLINCRKLEFFLKKQHNSTANLMTVHYYDKNSNQPIKTEDNDSQSKDSHDSSDSDVSINITVDLSLEEKVRDIQQRKLGQNFIHKMEQETSSLNLYNFEDFSIYTCKFYNNQYVKTPSCCSAGVIIYFISSLLSNENNLLYLKMNDQKYITNVIIMDKTTSQIYFALQIAQQGSDNKNKNKQKKNYYQMIIELISGLQIISDQFNKFQCLFKKNFEVVQQQYDLANLKEIVDETVFQNQLYDDLDQVLMQEGKQTMRNLFIAVLKYFNTDNFVADKDIVGACVGKFNFKYEFDEISDELLKKDGYFGLNFYQQMKYQQKE